MYIFVYVYMRECEYVYIRVCVYMCVNVLVCDERKGGREGNEMSYTLK